MVEALNLEEVLQQWGQRIREVPPLDIRVDLLRTEVFEYQFDDEKDCHRVVQRHGPPRITQQSKLHYQTDGIQQGTVNQCTLLNEGFLTAPENVVYSCGGSSNLTLLLIALFV